MAGWQRQVLLQGVVAIHAMPAIGAALGPQGINSPYREPRS